MSVHPRRIMLLSAMPFGLIAYVYGAQTVDVPLQGFAPLLESGYRAAFGLEP